MGPGRCRFRRQSGLSCLNAEVRIHYSPVARIKAVSPPCGFMSATRLAQAIRCLWEEYRELPETRHNRPTSPPFHTEPGPEPIPSASASRRYDGSLRPRCCCQERLGELRGSLFYEGNAIELPERQYRNTESVRLSTVFLASIEKVAALCEHGWRVGVLPAPPATPSRFLNSSTRHSYTSLPSRLRSQPASREQDRRVSSSIPVPNHGGGGVRVQSYAGSLKSHE